MANISPAKANMLRGIRWAARIISLSPGAAIILWSWGHMVYYGLIKQYGFGWEGPLRTLAEYHIVGGPLLLIGGIAWRWPRIGGVVLVLLSAYLLYVAFRWPSTDTAMYFHRIGIVFLIGGLLHLLAGWWGRTASAREGG